MKKFFAMLLTFVMLFSLAMPAMASDITGNTTSDVSATFDPEITISGISYSGETVTFDPASGNYVMLIPADFTGEYIQYSYVFAGTNLQYVPEPDWDVPLEQVQDDLWVRLVGDIDDEPYVEEIPLSYMIHGGLNEYIDGKLVVPNGADLSSAGVTLSVSYSNDNKATWSDPVSIAFKLVYSITASDTVNGTVTVPVSEYAAEGDTVYLTVTPEVGYELETLSVIGNDGEITPTKAEDGQYKFTMPASNVTISATFMERTTEPTTKTIYFDNTEGWETVRAYAWTLGTRLLGEWPGTAMTKVEGTESIYAIDVSSEAVNIIFNNGSTQTADLTIPTDDRNLYTYDTGVWSVYGSTVEPTDEAKWGTSKDALTESGTLAEAIDAAEADSSITYIQLQTNVTADSGYDIESGTFTLDLNGNTLSASNYTISVRQSAQVTLTDTANGGGGSVIATGANGFAVDALSGVVVIDGGSYTGSSAAVSVYNSTVTINSGTFTGVNLGQIAYNNGTLDLSGYDTEKLNGLTLSQWTDAELTVPNENIKLPEGYVFKDGENNSVTTLAPQTVYTIAAENTEPATITGVSISGNGVFYDETTKTYTILHDATDIIMTITGTNFANLTEDYGVTYNPGHEVRVYPGYVTVDKENNIATARFGASEFSTDNGFEIKYTTDGYNYTGMGIYVTYDDGAYDITTVTEGEGTVDVPATAAAGTPVTLTVTPADGYELDSLTVINNTTNEAVTVTDNQFTMPDADVTITATFKAITYAVNIDTNVANGTVSVDKSTAAQNDTVTVTVDAEAGYAYVVNSLKVTNDTTGEPVAVDEATKTFVMPASSVTVTATFEKLSTISADISWGSMSFTYTDGENGAEGAWSCEEGANKITVTNTGDNAFNAQPIYTAKDGYTEIEGIFYESMEATTNTMFADLYSGDAFTFYLKLFNKPSKALDGDTIATVTIQITEGIGQ